MDALYELLAPHFEKNALTHARHIGPTLDDPLTSSYLARLSTLSLADLASTEPASLLQSAQSHVRNLQALAKRSHKTVISSTQHLSNLTSLLPELQSQAHALRDDLPELEGVTTKFAQKYDRSAENEVLERRKRAMLLSRSVDRASDVLELPTLLSSTVSAAQTASATSVSNAATSYASALDLHAHIRRLTALYPHSELVATIAKQAEAEIQNLTSILIASLQTPGLKLATAMRTIGWLRRLAPELANEGHGAIKAGGLSTTCELDLSGKATSGDGTLGALFLVCRLRTLNETLSALEPLRELADQETTRREQAAAAAVAAGVSKTNQPTSTPTGGQSERYLKRYIDIFREQSFSIVSMYKSIFPTGLPAAENNTRSNASPDGNPLLPMPTTLASFALHLVDMLSATLRDYLPNVTDRPSRESLLTQVLYCAGSLGRLGADFGLFVALLEEDLVTVDDNNDDNNNSVTEPEWAQVMLKHRVQAGRLEVLARGVGTGRKVSGNAETQTATVTV